MALRFVVRTRNEFINVGSKLGDIWDGQPYMVTVKPFNRPRTLDQNRKAHAMIRELALHTGYTESAMKDIVKREFGPVQSYEIGSRIVEGPKGTSEYTVEELSDFIEHLYQLGAEIGCVFTDP